MPITMLGAEFKAFVNDRWDADCDLYMDDVVYLVNGKSFDDSECDIELMVSDTDKVTIHSGDLLRNSAPEFREDLVKFARKWRKERAVASILVEVPREQREAFLAHVQTFQSAKVIV